MKIPPFGIHGEIMKLIGWCAFGWATGQIINHLFGGPWA